ncbi:DpnII family type II restriction endonuclease [Deinococcus sp. UYEF24]
MLDQSIWPKNSPLLIKETAKNSLTDLEEYLDWKQIENDMYDFRDAILILNGLIKDLHYYRWPDEEPIGVLDHLTSAIKKDKNIVELCKLILAVPKDFSFEDDISSKRSVNQYTLNAKKVAKSLISMGLFRVLRPGANIADFIRTALVYRASAKRRFRVREKVASEVNFIMKDVLKELDKIGGITYGSKYTKYGWVNRSSTLARSRADYIIHINDIPIVAVVSVFQETTGGRQQRDLELTYPSLQSKLRKDNISLALIIDGRGIKEAPERVLLKMLEGVDICCTLNQALEGFLAKSLEEVIMNGINGSVKLPIDFIIESALSSGQSINVKDLTLENSHARAALASYAAKNSHLGLILMNGGESLSWERSSLVSRSIALKNNDKVDAFKPRDWMLLFSDLLQVGKSVSINEQDKRFSSNLISISSDNVIPAQFLLCGTVEAANSDILRSVALASLRNTHDANIAVVISQKNNFSASPSDDLVAVQATLSTNVIPLTPLDLERYAQGAKSPRDAFVEDLLRVTDLTKISPFVINSVTPRRIFFGREQEQAILLSTLSTNSVALLGGRRIGKTSLMQQVRRILSEAEYLPFFGDCQTVSDWQSFSDLAHRNWNVPYHEEFLPQHLVDIAWKISKNNDKRIVFLLDEIDQLLFWDKNQNGGATNAFFKACRTISQEGIAQFIFSGERTIATEMWNPQSPHWNFCRSLPVRQLSREASESLLIDNIKSMQVSIKDEDIFRNLAWKYTSGHPQIVQTLGDYIVRSLNNKSGNNRFSVSPIDLERICETYEFAEKYLTTYWGQSTYLERLISTLVADGINSPINMMSWIDGKSIHVSEEEVTTGLRMLEIYGVIEKSNNGYVLSAEWFPSALSFYGGVARVQNQYLERIK